MESSLTPCCKGQSLHFLSAKSVRVAKVTKQFDVARSGDHHRYSLALNSSFVSDSHSRIIHFKLANRAISSIFGLGNCT